MEFFYLLVGIILAGFAVFVVMRNIQKARLLEATNNKDKEVESVRLDYINLDKDYTVLKSNIDEKEKLISELENKLNNESVSRQKADTIIATLTSEKNALETSILKQEAQLKELSSKLEKLNADNQNIERELIIHKEENKSLSEKLETERKQLNDIQEKFKAEFENLAHKILQSNTKEFSTASLKNLSDVLSPLKEKLNSFEKKVEDTYEKGLKDQSSLKAELLRLHELSMKLDEDAQNLTRALKSDTKKQGNWGEIILERVLERSGLSKDQEYFIQHTAHDETGRVFRPDVVVKLPDDKHIVIDSKVSLTAYTQYVSEDEETKKEVALKLHLNSIKKHIKELSSKSYDSLSEFNSPDFVLMFMPIEPAFALAVQTDPELFNYAWKERVVIVSPTTLLATLRTVASIWKYEKQNQNALEIAERGGRLYDKFVNFIKDMESIGLNLNRATKAYDDANKKLSSGSGNILRQVEQLKKMGVNTKANLPDKYLIDNE
ncbi:MAG: DNA recombination protein RmuC [Marinilabiliales bacterium]|nr:MAG: DNA recombination protein RmuC [Marinilabiliales bacterium]